MIVFVYTFKKGGYAIVTIILNRVSPKNN